jgi:Rod binding domain-containing protein
MISAITAAASGASTPASSSSTPSPKLVHAAHEFEAQMMEELLKPMTSGNGLDGEQSGSASGSSGALGQFATEALGRGLSERGGFGIATSIIHQLSHSGNHAGATAVTGKLHPNTVMKAYK